VGALTEELELVQNPALGGILLWRFCTGYATGSQTQRPTPIPLLFLVLPIVLYADTAELVLSTLEGSGLRAFVTKLSDAHNSMTDIALSIHDRAIRSRSRTLRAMRLAIAKHLITIVPATAEAFTLISTQPSNLPTSTGRLMRAAYRLGVWCGSLTLYEVSIILKVTF